MKKTIKGKCKLRITTVKEFWFEAAHNLPNYNGDCSRVHGHSYRLQVGFTGTINEPTGMIVDFKEIKRIVQTYVVDILDHQFLNSIEDSGPLRNPTAENMLVWIKEKIEESILPSEHVELSFIRLYETVGSYAEWRR